MDEKRGNIVLAVIHSLTFKTVRIQGQIGATGKFLSPTNHNPSEIAFICPCGGCNALWKVVATKGIKGGRVETEVHLVVTYFGPIPNVLLVIPLYRKALSTACGSMH